MTVESFSPTNIDLLINSEIDNGGDPSTVFEIYVSELADPNNFDLLSEYDGFSTSYSLPDPIDLTFTITSGKVYFFKIRAVNSRGEGEFS